MPANKSQGWELIYAKTGKNRDYFDYNSLMANENTAEMMDIYRKLYPIARQRLYRLSKSDVADTNLYAKWVLRAKPSPSNLRNDKELLDALYDVSHMITNPKFSVSGFHAFEDRQRTIFENDYKLSFTDRNDYREFVRFLNKFASVVNNGLKYSVSYAYSVYEDIRNTLRDSGSKINVSFITDRFLDYKESSALRRGKALSIRMYDFKDMLKSYIRDNEERLRKDYSVYRTEEIKTKQTVPQAKFKEDFLSQYKIGNQSKPTTKKKRMRKKK